MVTCIFKPFKNDLDNSRKGGDEEVGKELLNTSDVFPQEDEFHLLPQPFLLSFFLLYPTADGPILTILDGIFGGVALQSAVAMKHEDHRRLDTELIKASQVTAGSFDAESKTHAAVFSYLIENVGSQCGKIISRTNLFGFDVFGL
ncbi:hypothetical protein STEG23_032856, partial [Scotinomys teguina]